MTTGNFRDLPKDFKEKANKIDNEINNRLPKLIGEMLVDGFRESFDRQRFNDSGQTPWEQVKRRKSGNEWFGFSYKANYSVPTGSRGYTPKGKPKRFGVRGGLTNFSPRASTRAILIGSGSTNLRDSIYLNRALRAMIVVASDQPHASVHNEGGEIKVFGRVTKRVPKRRFMGTSTLLNLRAKKLIDQRLNTFL